MTTNNSVLKLLIIGILSLMFFNAEKKECAIEESQANWSDWYQVDCFTGLDFRLKKQSFYHSVNKQDYRVEFRNRYNQHIYFNYAIVNPSEEYNIKHSGNTYDRTNLASNSTGGRTSKMLTSTNGIYVYVNKVHFGTDTGEYANCQ